MDRCVFEEKGYCIAHNIVDRNYLESLAVKFETGKAGKRVFDRSGPLAIDGLAQRISDFVQDLCGMAARPVRMIYFDKSPEKNWSLGWHQDRTIAVKRKEALTGYNIWTLKAGIPHAEPPFEIIQQSITVRISVDASTPENGALEVIPGSHRFGKLTDEEIQTLATENNSETILTSPGDIVLLSTPIVHRSNANHAAARRRTVQIDYSWATLPSPLEWAFEQ